MIIERQQQRRNSLQSTSIGDSSDTHSKCHPNKFLSKKKEKEGLKLNFLELFYHLQ